MERGRPTKWSGQASRYKSLGSHKLDTIITGHLTTEQVDAYQQLFRIEEITQLFKLSNEKNRSVVSFLPSTDSKANPSYKRDPSPPPKYDNRGNRVNTRDVIVHADLDKERNYLVEIVANNVKDYVLPSDYRKPVKTMEKIYIPVKDYPDINFVGLLLGPRGNTLRQLQEQSGARLAIRGKGSVKDGKSTSSPSDDMSSSSTAVANINPHLDTNSDDLHVVITSDTQSKIEKAIKLTNEVLEKAISSPVGQNDLKRGQLRELAVLNGTLRETKPYDPEAFRRGPQRTDITKIVCRQCGSVGHYTRDCKQNPSNGVASQGGFAPPSDYRRKYDQSDNYNPHSGSNPQLPATPAEEVLPPWKKTKVELPPWSNTSQSVPSGPPPAFIPPAHITSGHLPPPPGIASVRPPIPQGKPPPPTLPAPPTVRPPPPSSVKPPPSTIKPPPPTVKPPAPPAPQAKPPPPA